MTDTPDNIAAALAAFQADLPKVGKDNTAEVRSDKGSYRYSYADLGEISPIVLPLLGRHGLAWTTRPTLTHDGRFVLHYALTHTSDEVVEGEYPLPDPRSSPQVLGSAITYARRYSLCAVTGVAPRDDDDDAAAATQRTQQVQDRARSRATGNGGSDAQRATQPQQSADPQADAARELLRNTCKENNWSLDRVAALYADTHDHELRTAAMRDVEEFRKTLFSRPDHELREQEADQ